MPSQTNVVSFILRFVQETADTKHPADDADPPQAGWHGVVKHVQTDTEQHFTHLADALAFMARYVRLDDFSGTIELETQDRDNMFFDWLQRREMLSPNRIALIDAISYNQSITYREWNQQTNQLANFFQDGLGVRKGLSNVRLVMSGGGTCPTVVLGLS